ncbi:TauD/TfdA dioxygenase family protein [Candidatus Spongiihabitans sp.]|uniref:TauD/TfdA dioxygenase family protein n=1 Tax=Candidatus Spongiihabitans sp. TaxID=3101308 RepID=UPI003C7A9B20
MKCSPPHAPTRPILYVNQSFTRHLVGLSTLDSDRLLRYLYHHANRPEFQVRFRWSKGAVAMWDNRASQHYAVADYARPIAA